MVPGRLTAARTEVAATGRAARPPWRRAGLAATLIGALALAGVIAAPAGAVNTRVSVADFQWSTHPVISRGESVIWHWPGPDLQHSVSPNSPSSAPWDSDPGTTVPSHTLGDSFKVTFDEPGVYKFICKLHPSVRGTVTVKDEPGDPDSDPGPPPPPNIDTEPPYVDRWFFTRDGSTPAPAVIRSTSRGIRFMFATPERGTADVDYYRVIPRYRWKARRQHGREVKRRVKVGRHLRFAGYTEWRTHVGFNAVRFGARSRTFPNPRRGTYLGLFRATDEEANTVGPIRLRFEIKPGKGKK